MSVKTTFSKIGILIVYFSKILYWYLEAMFRFFVPPTMKSIDGEVILVTGATGGIGKELCRYIVKCGSNIKLVLWGTNISTLRTLAEELNSIGRKDLEMFCYQVDLSCKEYVNVCCKQVKAEVGSVTIIFNNAGIAPHGNFLQISDDQIEKAIQINLMSNFWIIRQFLPDMLKLNHGRIVNICSMGGLKAEAFAFPYFASKFAMNGYTEALKAELALFQIDGVYCTTVYPYLTQTPILNSLTVNEEGRSLPFGFQKILKAEDVAQKIVDGMRKEYEYIYLPRTIPVVVLMNYFMPKKLKDVLSISRLSSFTFKDPDEQKRFTTPLGRPDQNKRKF